MDEAIAVETAAMQEAPAEKSSLVRKFFYGEEERRTKEKATLEKKKQVEESKAINSIVDQKIDVSSPTYPAYRNSIRR